MCVWYQGVDEWYQNVTERLQRISDCHDHYQPACAAIVELQVGGEGGCGWVGE